MRITIERNEQAFDLAAAKRIVQQIKEKPESVIGLSTGRTTRNMHRLVAQIHRDQPFDATRATFFGIDEVTGVSRSYSGACYTILKTEIIDDLGVDEDHFLMLPTATDNLDANCKHFSDELQHKGGIDLLILGLGENGHLGFNQPGTSFESTVGIGSMDSALENRIRRETGVPAEHSLGGVTLGLSDIMQVRRIILVVKGTSKAEIVKQVLRGPVSTDVPASILQHHPHCEVLLDADAASCLPLVEKKSEGDKPSPGKDPKIVEQALTLYDSRVYSMDQISKTTGISRRTLYKYINLRKENQYNSLNHDRNR